MTSPSRLHAASFALASITLALCSAAIPANAQTVAAKSASPALLSRIAGSIDSSQRATLSGSHPVAAAAANDAGSVPGDTPLQGMDLVFSRSAAQEAALQTLIAAQQNPASPLYHQWLTPDQFAAQFGVADADISKVDSWLQQQGFTVNAVGRSRNHITFSGTAAQVATAFGTQIHYFKAGGETHFAPASDLSIPSALAGVVQSVNNLSDYRPRPRVKFSSVNPKFTSSQTGNHFLTPKDIATIYDINAAYSAGYTGANQSIAIIGQTSVYTSDITNFQTAAGLTPKAPTLVLMPNSGSSTIYSGDEAESDLDLEYSSAIAPGANVFFVYTGSNTNVGVVNALEYAIDERIAPVLSISYGQCETTLGSSYASYNAFLAQAAAQGQSVFGPGGDNGSSDCWDNGSYGLDGLTLAQATALSVDFPASSQYVTGVGGTEFPAADVAAGNTTYWAAQATSDIVGSALKYIPEQVWNDDNSTSGAAGALSAGGGGTSTLTPRPTWQTGVPGIPAGAYRLVPDVSLAASPTYPGYLYCTSDTSAWSTGQNGSCSVGFRDSNNSVLTVAGGTSFATPIFAGMVALINQARNSTGQGVINPILYSLASNSTTYASAFHDTTSGTNACTAGAAYCSTAGAGSYAATVGYDEATGLGSVDLYNLLTAWPANSAVHASGLSTTTKLTVNTTVPAVGATDSITIAVTPTSSLTTTTPTGSLSLSVDGTVVNASLALSSGSATYSFSSGAAGEHVIVATYSGDGTFAASTGTTTVNVGGTLPSGGTFTTAATNVSVQPGASGVSTVTITPAGGYTGTITWALSSSTLNETCYSISNVTVSGTAAVTTPLTFYTSSSQCSGGVMQNGPAGRHLVTPLRTASTSKPNGPPFGALPAGAAFAGLLLVGCMGRRARGLRLFVTCGLIGLLGLSLSGCGSSTSNTSTTVNQAPGTYTVSLVGTDSLTNSITASTTLTLTVQ